MAGAVAVGLWFVSRRLGRWASLAALAMIFARVYIGAHYPADVAAGFVLGAVAAAIVHLVAGRGVVRLVTTVSHTRLRPLLMAGTPA